ncbi:sulfatase family protein [Prosthecobacter dejongeii]|uniref:Arylsulfatase A-like enzyme n=1 Tax=Prosthecobacter dejongeii TaxID=48465 RepID=A0A7W7YGQ8_9BACT|nr:arylsulfatase [Prosthecobacter dejongeii]MBB5035799.1 arylsulfatase A-like enzyme [Prosthecobacter dejongeii]
MKFLLALSCLFALTLSAAERPNVVIILADDFGYGSAGCYGADGKLVQTPHLDRLAREGRRFTDASTTSSVCSPTRYSLITGRYCWRTTAKSGVLGTFSPLHIETTRLNMASLLKKQGYSTAAIGKWHLGYGRADDSPQWRTDYTAELSPGPLEIGFDYHFGVPANHGDITGIYVENRHVYGLRSGKIPAGMKVPGPDSDDPNYKPTYTAEDTESGRAKILDLDAPRRVNDRVMPLLTQKATSWIRAQPKDHPFFLYYTPVAVHNPVTPSAELAGKSPAGLYGDWIHELDRSVGSVLTALDESGQAGNTLILFTSDNGGVFKPERDMLQTTAYKAGLKVNGALRGGKHTVWQGGFKVPFIARWPGKIPAGTVCDEMVSVADLLATTAALVGEKIPTPEQAAEDSHNFLPALLGENAPPARDHLIVHSSDGVFAIRQGPWKWVEGVPAPGVKQRRSDEFHAQLYNLEKDPAETLDLSAQHPDIVEKLSSLLTRYREGGYSRELPPVKVKQPTKTTTFAPIPGTPLLEASLTALPDAPWAITRGTWKAEEGAVWGLQKGSKDAGATLRVPVTFTEATLDYRIQFQGADRHSLRIEAGSERHSFRIEISPTHLGLTKNPDPGQTQEHTVPLARKALELQPQTWYPVRITFHGSEVTVQVQETRITGTHPLLQEEKKALNFLVFGDRAGFKDIRLVPSSPSARP